MIQNAAAATMLFALVTGPGATRFTPQADRSPSLIIAVRCKQQHCYTYEQWARPGFDRKKDAPEAGPGKFGMDKQRAMQNCIADRNRYAAWGGDPVNFCNKF